MQIVRKYKKLSWFEFIDRLHYDLDGTPACLVYLELMDELYLRKVESISEGSTYKIKKPSLDLLNQFEKRLQEDPKFACSEQLADIKSMAKHII